MTGCSTGLQSPAMSDRACQKQVQDVLAMGEGWTVSSQAALCWLQGGLVGSAGSGMRMKDWDKTLEDSGDEGGGGGDESESDAGDSSGLGE